MVRSLSLLISSPRFAFFFSQTPSPPSQSQSHSFSSCVFFALQASSQLPEPSHQTSNQLPSTSPTRPSRAGRGRGDEGFGRAWRVEGGEAMERMMIGVIDDAFCSPVRVRARDWRVGRRPFGAHFLPADSSLLSIRLFCSLLRYSTYAVSSSFPPINGPRPAGRTDVNINDASESPPVQVDAAVFDSFF